ncbi:MAG: OmpA family protein [Tateyamaria sp.]|uniref:OmpA family protein n=1 Tax=Tateyamaria sp. TaxID=1929288 RepID=UPI00329ACD34
MQVWPVTRSVVLYLQETAARLELLVPIICIKTVNNAKRSFSVIAMARPHFPTSARFLSGLFLLVAITFSGSLRAQSVITLDDLDMGVTGTSIPEQSDALPQPSGQMGACLVDSENCDSDEFRSGASFSLDDVVNLGIIDREEAAAQPSEEAKKMSTSTDTGEERVSQSLPSIDIEILFNSGSEQIRAQEFTRLIDLAALLGGESFDTYRFLLLGHTDAVGSAENNLALSTRRAESVATALREISGFGPERVLASGLGETRLKDTARPEDGVNRRVQLVLLPR